MAGMDFFIRPATGTSSSDWIRIPNSDIKVRSARRITRTIVRGQEGDNLHDEGSESTIYTVSGEMQIDEYKKILTMYRCLLYTSPSPRDMWTSRMPSSA